MEPDEELQDVPGRDNAHEVLISENRHHINAILDHRGNHVRHRRVRRHGFGFSGHDLRERLSERLSVCFFLADFFQIRGHQSGQISS